MSEHYNSETKSKGGLKPIHALIPALICLLLIVFFFRPQPRESRKKGKPEKTAVVNKKQTNQKVGNKNNKSQQKSNAKKGNKKAKTNQNKKQNRQQAGHKANTNLAGKTTSKTTISSKPNTAPKGIDSDRDGTVDTKDKCPGKYGKYTGCPPRHFDEDDFDNDGILDKNDKCSSVSGIEKYNGCPG